MVTLALNMTDASPLNMYAEKAPEGQRSDLIFRSAPGLIEHAVVGSGPIRGLFAQEETLYIVSGVKLYSWDDGLITEIGMIEGSNPVSFAVGGGYLAVNGDKLYIINLTTGAFIETPQGPFSNIVYSDGRFIGAVRASDTWQVSALLDPFTWNPLATARAEFNDDVIEGIVNDSGVLYLFGSKSIEIWSNVGTLPFPYARNTVVEIGCKTGYSIQKLNGAVYWLGDNGRIYASQGQAPQRISSEFIENQIIARSAEKITSTKLNNRYYALNLETISFLFDTTTGFFHTRKSLNSDNKLVSWQYAFNTQVEDTEYMGSVEDGTIVKVVRDVYTERGRPLVRELTSDEIFAETRRLVVHKLVVDIDGGYGGTLMLDWSSDGGLTTQNEMLRSMGSIGDYRRRIEFWRLGQLRRRIFRIRVSDNVPLTVYGLYLEAS